MWQTLLINIKLHLREKTQLFWLFAFPIILATMFNGMFGNIAESFELHTLDVTVVEDNAWKTSYGAQTLIEGISSESSALSDNHVKVSADGKNGTGTHQHDQGGIDCAGGTAAGRRHRARHAANR